MVLCSSAEKKRTQKKVIYKEKHILSFAASQNKIKLTPWMMMATNAEEKQKTNWKRNKEAIARKPNSLTQSVKEEQIQIRMCRKITEAKSVDKAQLKWFFETGCTSVRQRHLRKLLSCSITIIIIICNRCLFPVLTSFVYVYCCFARHTLLPLFSLSCLSHYFVVNIVTPCVYETITMWQSKHVNHPEIS